jgi:hypothetical protein
MLCETCFEVEWKLLLKYIMENSAKEMSGQKGVCHDPHIWKSDLFQAGMAV